MNTPESSVPDVPVRYRLRLQGRINYAWSDWLSDAQVNFEGEGRDSLTIVTGTVRDQSALFGLLSFIRNLGIRLISVETL